MAGHSLAATLQRVACHYTRGKNAFLPHPLPPDFASKPLYFRHAYIYTYLALETIVGAVLASCVPCVPSPIALICSCISLCWHSCLYDNAVTAMNPRRVAAAPDQPCRLCLPIVSPPSQTNALYKSNPQSLA
jgi:hypothetical protein